MHRIGLAGFGSIAENGHLPALQSFPEIEVVAIADLSPERLERAREVLPQAQFFSSPLAMLAEAELTGIDICTPPSTHADLIQAACARGLNTVICEKPFVLSEDDYRRVAHARERSRSRIISVNNWLQSDLFGLVHAAIQSGDIGDVQHVRLETGRPAAARGNTGWLPGWRTDAAHSGGGIVLDHGWHQLYLIFGWVGAWPQSVQATLRTVDPRHAPVEDEAVIDLSFPSSSARIELSWTSNERTNAGLVSGTQGTIDVHDDRIEVHRVSGTTVHPFGGRLTQSSYHPDWFQKMLEYNVLNSDSTEADRNFSEAGVLVATIQAIYRSSSLGGGICPVPGPGAGEGIGETDGRRMSRT